MRKSFPRAMRAIVGGLVILGTLGLAPGCGETPGDPEARLRRSLASAEHAAERGDVDALAELLAPDYSDVDGRDRRALVLMLRGLFLRYRHVELVVTLERVELFSPVLARVDARIIAAGAGTGRLSADGFRVEMSLRDDGDGWRVTSAGWTGARGI